jgi:hypothetical protein
MSCFADETATRVYSTPPLKAPRLRGIAAIESAELVVLRRQCKLVRISQIDPHQSGQTPRKTAGEIRVIGRRACIGRCWLLRYLLVAHRLASPNLSGLSLESRKTESSPCRPFAPASASLNFLRS